MAAMYSLTGAGAEMMAMLAGFARLAAKVSAETKGVVDLPDVQFTLRELLSESTFPPENGQEFVDSMVAQGYLAKVTR